MFRISVKESWSSFSLIRLNAFGFGVTGFVLAMDTVVLPVIVLTLAPESLKNTYLAMLGMGGLLVAAVIQPFIGRLSDRTRSPLGRRVPYIICGTLVVCASLSLTLLAPNFLALFAAWMFIQASLNVAYGPGMALIRDLVPRARIGVASSLKILMDAVGGMLMIAAAGTLLARGTGLSDFARWEWLTLALLGGVLALSVVVTCVTVLHHDPRQRARPVRPSSQPPRPVLNSQLGLFLISRLLLMTAISSFYTYGLFFLRDVVEVDNPPEALSRMILAIGGAIVVAVYISGWVSDRIGPKPVVIAGAVGAALSTLLMLTAETATDVVIIASVIGASVGALLSANWALANELGDEQQAGVHIGIVNLSTIGGAAVARLLGPGIDLLNLTAEDLGYRVLISGCAALFVAGAVTVLPVNPARLEQASQEEPPEPTAAPPPEP